MTNLTPRCKTRQPNQGRPLYDRRGVRETVAEFKKEETMTIKDIQMQSNPVRKAAMLHCRFWHTAAWEKARNLRDDLINEHDPEWPHDRFWDIVDEINMAAEMSDA